MDPSNGFLPIGSVSACEHCTHFFSQVSLVAVSVEAPLGMPMEEPAAARLFDSFAPVRDPRSANARPRWFAMVVMALCALISGAAGWEDMEEYGHAPAAWHGGVPLYEALWIKKTIEIIFVV